MVMVAAVTVIIKKQLESWGREPQTGTVLREKSVLSGSEGEGVGTAWCLLSTAREAGEERAVN